MTAAAEAVSGWWNLGLCFIFAVGGFVAGWAWRHESDKHKRRGGRRCSCPPSYRDPATPIYDTTGRWL